jgi:alcohol dehydrogenase
MMAAALMGATAFQKGLGGIHALSHPIGALYDTHHGMTNAVVMPAVLAANRPAIEAKIARLALYLGVPGGFDGFLGYILELRAELGVPGTLEAFGVPRDGFDRICDMALADPTAAGNPLTLTRELAARMLEAAFGA